MIDPFEISIRAASIADLRSIVADWNALLNPPDPAEVLVLQARIDALRAKVQALDKQITGFQS